MILITDVSLDSLRLHEKATAANATLGSYGKLLPVDPRESVPRCIETAALKED